MTGDQHVDPQRCSRRHADLGHARGGPRRQRAADARPDDRPRRGDRRRLLHRRARWLPCGHDPCTGPDRNAGARREHPRPWPERRVLHAAAKSASLRSRSRSAVRPTRCSSARRRPPRTDMATDTEEHATMDTISHHDTPTATKSNAPLKALVVLAHPERRSFNGAMADVAVETLRGLGHQVAFSDLYRIGFDPVSDRRNFREREESRLLQAAGRGGPRHRDQRIRAGRGGGDRQARSGRPDDLAVPAVVVQRARNPEGLGGQGVRLQPDLWPRALL